MTIGAFVKATVLVCAALSIMNGNCRPVDVESNSSDDRTGVVHPCNVPEVSTEKINSNMSEPELESLTRHLTTRTEGLVIYTDQLMAKMTNILKSKFALDCVDIVTSYSGSELDCSNFTSRNLDQYKACTLSAYKVMASFKDSVELIRKWDSRKQLVVTEIDLTELGMNIEHFICDLFIDIYPIFENKSELMDVSPDPVQLVRDLTNSQSKTSLSDLMKIDNKRCGVIESDMNEIQAMHFMYQFLFDLTETTKRIHSIFSNIPTKSDPLEVSSTSSLSSTPDGATVHPVTTTSTRATTGSASGKNPFNPRDAIIG